MNRLKRFKSLTLLLMLFSFVAAGSLNSCREQKKQENTDQQEEHPTEEGSTSDEHPTEEGSTKDEHPTKEVDEHPQG